MARPRVAHARRKRAQGADTWQEATRVHADAHVGRHVAGRGVDIWRTRGLVGLGKMLGAITQLRYPAPIFKLDFTHFFFRVGLCSHTFLFCRRCGDMAGVGCDRMAEIAWTRVHAIINGARASLTTIVVRLPHDQG